MSSLPIHSAAQGATKLLPVLTLIAFILGVLLNSFVFWGWGLSFLQVATPTDVFSAALDIAIRTFPDTLCVIFGLWIISIYPWKIKGFYIATAVYSILAMLIAFLVIKYRLVIPALLLAFNINFGLLMGHATGRASNWQKKVALAAVLFLAVGGNLAVALSQISSKGFLPKPTTAAKAEIESACSANVMWIGSGSFIVDCRPGLEEMRVIVREDVTFRVKEKGTPWALIAHKSTKKTFPVLKWPQRPAPAVKPKSSVAGEQIKNR